MADGSSVRVLAPREFAAAVPALAHLIVDAVEGGASVNFLADVTEDEAATWWQERTRQVAAGTISVLVAEVGTAIVGCTILERSVNPNAPHRAEVGKVLVAQSWRRRGIGRMLMETMEALARSDGRWLLHLDTTADTEAERFYRSLGWVELGTMPNHSLLPDGTQSPTVFFWKDLRAG